MNRPEKSGIYAITCPSCQGKYNVKLPGKDAIPTPPPASAPASAPATPTSVLDNSSAEQIQIESPFLIEKEHVLECPHENCNKSIPFNFSTPGWKEFACPACKGKIKVYAKNKTKVIDLTPQDGSRVIGKLVLLRRGWLNKDYPLHNGSNIVGRYDEAGQSDIAIKNDSTMSRRSIDIEVKSTPQGYIYRLTVNRALNPVYHNNHPLHEGESISLNFGDLIVLGKTRLRLESNE